MSDWQVRAVTMAVVLLPAAMSGDGAPDVLPAQSAHEPVTFSRHVAPIIVKGCLTCHNPDGDAPISLVTYSEVRQRASQIARVTAKRLMPPWKPEPGHGEFLGDRRLTDEEIDTIQQWVNGGALEGPSMERPLDVGVAKGWALGPPDVTVQLPEYGLRADGPDVFRNFVVTVPGAGTRFVRGLLFRPGNRAVHHANVRVDPTPASRRLDEADPAPGYEGMILRSADFPDGHFLGWTPGQAPPFGFRDLSWRLQLGTDLVVQLHMQPTGAVETITGSIGLYFTDEPPSRTPVMIRLGPQTLDIPAGASRHRMTDAYRLPVDVEIHAIQPHAHVRAREVRAWATLPGGETRNLIWIADWDFRWQDVYRYRSPFWLPAGTRVEMEYVFDNSVSNPRNPDRPPRRVEWGWRSSDEMGDVWIQAMTRSAADRFRLLSDVRPKMLAADAEGCEVLIARDPAHVSLRNDAALIYMALGNPARALEHFEAASRLEPRSALGRFNTGVALEALDRRAEAERAYRQALELAPTYSAAHNNLANLLLSAGFIDQARQHYVRAVEFDAANVEARRNLGAVLVASYQPEAALAQFAEALRHRPDWPPLLVSVTWLRAAYRDAAIRRPAEAVNLAQRAITLMPDDAGTLDVLAVAYASAGRFDEAIRAAEQAAAAAARSGQTQLAGQIRARLERFRQRQPFVLP